MQSDGRSGARGEVCRIRYDGRRDMKKEKKRGQGRIQACYIIEDDGDDNRKVDSQRGKKKRCFRRENKRWRRNEFEVFPGR